jgi:hypothetical protein
MFQSQVGVSPFTILFVGTTAYLLLSMYHIFYVPPVQPHPHIFWGDIDASQYQ